MDRGRFDETDARPTSTRWFFLLIIASQIAGILAFVLIVILLGQYRGGFGWGSNLDKVFNNHPLFMTLGMVLFYGDAILVYRFFTGMTKLHVKILHASLLGLSLICSSIGLKAVFDSHNHAVPPEKNLQTFHSWLGLTTVILFGCQWICGFVSFLFPQLNERIRRAYMPSHKLWGKVIFMLGIGTVCVGITEYAIFEGLYGKKSLANQRRVINFFGILILIFAVIILYLVGHPDFQRTADNETERRHFND